jgi:hypothetical protein
VLDKNAFNLDHILEIEPEFLTEDHDHARCRRRAQDATATARANGCQRAGEEPIARQRRAVSRIEFLPRTAPTVRLIEFLIGSNSLT